MKHRFAIIAIAAVSLVGFVSFATPAFAEEEKGLECAVLPKEICDAAKTGSKDGISGTGVWKLLIWVLNIMIALVGLAAIGSMIFAGILYSSAQGNSEQVMRAKKIILNTVIGIIAFSLMYLGLNWLIPGGVFN